MATACAIKRPAACQTYTITLERRVAEFEAEVKRLKAELVAYPALVEAVKACAAHRDGGPGDVASDALDAAIKAMEEAKSG